MAGKSTDSTPKKRGKPPKGWKEVFLRTMRSVPNVRAACEVAKVDRQTAYNHRDSDPAFAAAWDDAVEDSTDLVELEIHRRAVKGVEKPVFYKGVRVSAVREYSDTLLMFYMKAYRPEKFRDNYDINRLIEQLGVAGAAKPPAAAPKGGRKGGRA